MTDTQALLDANERIADLAKRVAELEIALSELINHTHNCEKELTEELHHQDFCGESLPLTNARKALRKDAQ